MNILDYNILGTPTLEGVLEIHKVFRRIRKLVMIGSISDLLTLSMHTSRMLEFKDDWDTLAQLPASLNSKFPRFLVTRNQEPWTCQELFWGPQEGDGMSLSPHETTVPPCACSKFLKEFFVKYSEAFNNGSNFSTRMLLV